MDQPKSSRVSCGVQVFALVALSGVTAAVLIPHLNEARVTPNSELARSDMRDLISAQSLFREGDKEGDENLDYGTLAELSQAGLIDDMLGSGSKWSYLFQVAPSRTTPEFLWFAVAAPEEPTVTGDYYFCTNHEGVVFYTLSRGFELNDLDCSIPASARPIGK